MHGGGQAAILLITLGALLLAGMLTDFVGSRLHIPRVTILIVLGVLAGPAGFDVLPQGAEQWYALISNIALLLVGFMLGGKLSVSALKEHGRKVLWISVFEVVGVAALVFFGLWLLGVAVPVALILAGIGPASAPAAVTGVVHELRSEGPFSETLLGIVAIDDAWGLIAFSVLLAVAQVVAGAGGAADALARGAWELGGAVGLGAALGVPATWLCGRIRQDEPMQAEALGFVLVCGGLALWLEVSFLLAAMVLGVVLTNFAKHHEEPFAKIRELEWPIMILFFALAGSTLHLDKLAGVGAVGAAYVFLRAVGLLVGAHLGGRIGGAGARIRRWMGFAIWPQAGVALGMALVAGHAFPDRQDFIMTLVIGSTVVFELVGPVCTRLALVRAGEGGKKS